MNKRSFAIQNISSGRLNALVKNIMEQTGVSSPEEAVRLMNSGQMRVTLIEKPLAWSEEDGIIHLTVTANGESGFDLSIRWDRNWAKMPYRISPDVQEVLLQIHGRLYGQAQVAVIKGGMFSSEKRTTDHIRLVAEGMGLSKPSPGIAWLIREQFSDDDLKEMDLDEIIVMHHPINGEEGFTRYLTVSRNQNEEMLSFSTDSYRHVWSNHDRYKIGFAFML